MGVPLSDCEMLSRTLGRLRAGLLGRQVPPLCAARESYRRRLTLLELDGFRYFGELQHLSREREQVSASR